MKYINTFKNHASYEEKLNGGGVDISLPNVSYCEDVKDVHYTPYNLVRFYVGNIPTQPSIPIFVSEEYAPKIVQISEGNKWYTATIPSNYHLNYIIANNIEEIVIKANIKKGNLPIVQNCSQLKKLSFTDSNTSNTTNMNKMFSGCTSLTSLDLSSFNTSNVTDMSDMFNVCSGLTSLDLSSFNTSNVTNMKFMFAGCSKLTSLGLSSFNTSNVTQMYDMFAGCSKLTSLDLSNFDTSNVTNMNIMFGGCSSLTSLDLSGWKISKAISTSQMFIECSSLKTITMKGCTKETIDMIKIILSSSYLDVDGITIVTE